MNHHSHTLRKSRIWLGNGDWGQQTVPNAMCTFPHPNQTTFHSQIPLHCIFRDKKGREFPKKNIRKSTKMESFVDFHSFYSTTFSHWYRTLLSALYSIHSFSSIFCHTMATSSSSSSSTILRQETLLWWNRSKVLFGDGMTTMTDHFHLDRSLLRLFIALLGMDIVTLGTRSSWDPRSLFGF